MKLRRDCFFGHVCYQQLHLSSRVTLDNCPCLVQTLLYSLLWRRFIYVHLHIDVPALGKFYLCAPDLFYLYVNVVARVCPNGVLSQPLNEAAS